MSQKKFVMFCRVSTQRQKEEGVSLATQAEVIGEYVRKQEGDIVKSWSVDETGWKPEKRSYFKKMLAYVREHAGELDGVVFYSSDRACRNDRDRIELCVLEREFEVPVRFATEPHITLSSAAGKMLYDVMGSIHEYQSSQTSEKIKANMERVATKEGRFVRKAPFGYENIREHGRASSRTHPVNAVKVKHIFEEFATGNYTIDTIREHLLVKGIYYKDDIPKFGRSMFHAMLRDRVYLGELKYKGKYYSGAHEPLVSESTFNKVQELLGNRRQVRRDITYSGGLFTCAECGNSIIGEEKHKQGRTYRYYRCSQYNVIEGHERFRINEANLELLIVEMLERLHWEHEETRQTFKEVLRESAADEHAQRLKRLRQLHRDYEDSEKRKGKITALLIDGRLDPEEHGEALARQRMQSKRIRLEIESLEKQGEADADLAVATFELLQDLPRLYVTAEPRVRRSVLEILLLNCYFDGVSLAPTWNTPFDLVAAGRILSCGGRYRT